MSPKSFAGPPAARLLWPCLRQHPERVAASYNINVEMRSQHLEFLQIVMYPVSCNVIYKKAQVSHSPTMNCALIQVAMPGHRHSSGCLVEQMHQTHKQDQRGQAYGTLFQPLPSSLAEVDCMQNRATDSPGIIVFDVRV